MLLLQTGIHGGRERERERERERGEREGEVGENFRPFFCYVYPVCNTHTDMDAHLLHKKQMYAMQKSDEIVTKKICAHSV